jgi:hypothetical protein
VQSLPASNEQKEYSVLTCSKGGTQKLNVFQLGTSTAAQCAMVLLDRNDHSSISYEFGASTCFVLELTLVIVVQFRN